ncbi:MAG: cysteine desulfurase family protein [Bacteroidales bacterium]
MKHEIYLDNAATTRIDKRVWETMLPFLNDYYGNASSLHHFGTSIKEQIQESRKKIAQYIKCEAEEIIFTSSGTEANNFALKGIAFANHTKGNHIIVSSIEHDCVLNTCKWLETQGFFVTYLPVDKDGFIDLDLFKRCINLKTILVSVMHVNNEIGSIQPISEISKICKERKVYFHSDACQSFGKIPVDIQNIDLLTINAHKIYGPKGIGALIIKKGTNITPLLHGGGQEFGLRSSTENIAGIVGFAKAIELCFAEMTAENDRISNLQKKIFSLLNDTLESVYFNGSIKNRLPHNINFCISSLEGESMRLLLLLDEEGIAVSSGSACSSNSENSASHVLQAIGLNPFEARGSIRVSLGRYNTENEINYFLDKLQEVICKLKPIFT